MAGGSFYSTRRYQRAAEPAELLADLDEVRKNTESARRWRNASIALLVAGVATGFLVGVSADGFLGLVVGLFLVAVFGFFMYLASRRILDERRRKIAACVVRALACDLPPGGTLDLGVDFNDYHKDRFKLDSFPVGRYSAARYRLKWLSVSGALADGSKVELAADHLVTRKERSKTKGRKKVKETIHEQVRLCVRPAALPPLAPHLWPDHVRRSPLPGGAYFHAARCKKGRLLAEVRTHRATRIIDKGVVLSGKDIEARLASHHTLLAPLLGAFAALRTCRKGA